MAPETAKFVVFVPVDHADRVREALGDAGAGRIGNYSHCSFSIRGVGRFQPDPHARPYVGQPGDLEAVEEERIEVVVERRRLPAVIQAVRRVHPYEEMAFDVYPLLNPEELAL